MRQPLVLGVALAGLLLGGAEAGASPVSIGGYWIETDLAVGSVDELSGEFQSLTASLSPTITALGDNWGGPGFNLSFDEPAPYSAPPYPNAVVKATFKNPVRNGDGIDIFAFEQGSAPNPVGPYNSSLELLSAASSNGDPWFDLVVLGFLTAQQVGGEGTTTGLYVLGLDLSLLGIAAGAQVSTLYFGNSGNPNISGVNNHDPDILYMAGVAPVPVPAALPLLASGLGALGVIGWRRRSRVA